MSDSTVPRPEASRPETGQDTNRPPETAAPPQELVRLLQDFTLEANHYVDAAGGRNDMHRTDLNALAVIMRHTAAGKVVTPGVLRAELRLSSPPATTALVDRLHASGHVVRERLGTDRRQVQLQMTPKAYRMAAPCSCRWLSAWARPWPLTAPPRNWSLSPGS